MPAISWSKVYVFACGWTAAILYFTLWPVVGYDVPGWLLRWYAHIVETGRFAVFAEPFGNYTPPYLYLLALFSWLDRWLEPLAVLKVMAALQSVGLAASVYYLLRTVEARQPLAGAATILVLPPVVLNGPVLSQCDPLWVAACIMAVAEAARSRPLRMLLWCGVAGSVKLQAAFLAPFAVAMMVRLKAPHYWAAIPLLVYVVLMAPAAVAGWPISDLTLIYLRQARWAQEFISNAANPWTLGNFAPDLARGLFPVGYIAATAAAVALTAALSRSRSSAPALIRSALLPAIALPYLLPSMHERYFLLADILAFALAWLARDRRSIAVAVLVVGSSTLALAGYLARELSYTLMGTAFMTAALAILLWESLAPSFAASPWRSAPRRQ